MMAGFLLSGLSFENYSEVFDVVDLKTSSNNTWMDLMKQMKNIGIGILNEILNNNKEEAVGEDIIIATDGAWSHRGWNANECVVTVFDLFNSTILDFEIVIRCLPGDQYGNFVGASSQMESEGLRRICKRLKESGIKVDAVLHDGDGST